MEIIVIKDKENKDENDIISTLFSVRSEELECRLEERENFIKENHLKDITYDDILKELDKVPNVDKQSKGRIMELLEKLLDNKSEIQDFDCKLYYKAGIKDAVSIILGSK